LVTGLFTYQPSIPPLSHHNITAALCQQLHAKSCPAREKIRIARFPRMTIGSQCATHGSMAVLMPDFLIFLDDIDDMF
jgi:hypothetical protein